MAKKLSRFCIAIDCMTKISWKNGYCRTQSSEIHHIILEKWKIVKPSAQKSTHILNKWKIAKPNPQKSTTLHDSNECKRK
jgi:hypothetical protein